MPATRRMIDVVAVPAVTPAKDSRYGVCCSTSISWTRAFGASSTAVAGCRAKTTATMTADKAMASFIMRP